MYLVARPAKSFLFTYLGRCLQRQRGAIALDAASAGLKNRRLFNTQRYIGLDLDLPALQSGLQKYPAADTAAIHADIRELDRLSAHSIDTVVSTNTLKHLAPGDRLIAVKQLSRLVNSRGTFFCDTPLDDTFDQILSTIKTEFKRVDVVYYNNVLSRWYEKKHENASGELVVRPHGKGIAILFLILECITCRYRIINHNALIIAAETVYAATNQFSFQNLTNVSERLYSAIQPHETTS